MRHALAVLFLCASILFGSTAPSLCADTDQAPPLRVAFNELPPWKIVMTGGRKAGVDIDLIRMLAQKMGLRIEFRDFPFARGLKQLENGGVDMAVGVLKRPEREKYLHFISPAYKNKSNKAFYVRPEDKDKIKSYKDLSGLVVGVINGGRYFKRFDLDTSLIKEMTTDPLHNQNKLVRGRIDAYIGTESAEDYRLLANGFAGKIVKAPYVFSKRQDVFMVLSKDSPHAHRLDEFNRHLKELVESGVIEKIKKKYLFTH